MVGIMNIEETERSEGQPQLIIETRTNIDHSALWIERKGLARAVRPESVCHGELELSSPVVVSDNIGEGSIKTKTITDIKRVVQKMGTKARNDIRTGGIDMMFIIDTEATASL